MSEWIPVGDRLPLPNIRVLVCRAGKTSYQPFFGIHKNRLSQPWDYTDGDTCNRHVTHWMPIPAMPTE